MGKGGALVVSGVRIWVPCPVTGSSRVIWRKTMRRFLLA